MKKEVTFTIMLTPTDRYRHRHTRIKGVVTSFVVQYETKLGEQWFPVVRYDTGHGFAHRDVVDRKGKIEKTRLFTEDYNEALTFAEHDLRSNWPDYKRRFFQERNDGE